MKYRHGVARSLWMIVVSLALAFGGLSSVLADERPAPVRDRDIESLLAEKLERLSMIETSAPGLYRSTAGSAVEVPAAAVYIPPLFEGQVDCDAGESVNEILAGAIARQVILHLSGTCPESVRVDRPGVMLSGSLSGTAVIDPPDDADGVPVGPAIYAIGAHELTLEDLTLTGGTIGLEARSSTQLTLTNVHAVDNQDYGVVLSESKAAIGDSELSRNGVEPLVAQIGSYARVTDSVMNDNAWGPYSVLSSAIILIRCEIANNGGGITTVANSYLSISGSSLQGNGWESIAADHSTLWVSGSTLESPGYSGTVISAWRNSEIFIRDSELHGHTWAARLSSVEMRGVRYGSGEPLDKIQIVRDSWLEIADSGTQASEIDAFIALQSFTSASIITDGSIRGRLYVGQFSDANISTRHPIDGWIDCYDRSRVICDPWPTGGVNGCE